MTIAHVANGTPVFATNATISVAWPSHSTNNIGIMLVNLEHDAESTPTPSGWTLLDVSDPGGGRTLSIFGKVAASGSEANVTVSITGGDTNDVHGGAITTFSGGTLTLSATAVDSDAAGTTNVPYGSYTPADDNTLVLICAGIGDADANSMTTPSGFTQSYYAETTLGYDTGISLNYQIQTTATAITGANMVTENNTSSQTSIFSLEAAAAGSALPFMMHLS